MSVYNSLKGLNKIRDFLRTNLQDPYVLAGGRPRASWIFTDEPFSSATYPRIKLHIQDHTANPIDIGSDYMNWEQVIVKIFFYTKQDFKVELNGTVYSNEQLVYEYCNRIHDLLKTNFDNLYQDGVKGFRLLKINTPAWDSDYQCHIGSLHCRFWLFRK